MLKIDNHYLSLQQAVTSKVSNIVTNIVIMKKMDILLELSKCDTEAQSEQMLLEKYHP